MTQTESLLVTHCTQLAIQLAMFKNFIDTGKDELSHKSVSELKAANFEAIRQKTGLTLSTEEKDKSFTDAMDLLTDGGYSKSGIKH